MRTAAVTFFILGIAASANNAARAADSNSQSSIATIAATQLNLDAPALDWRTLQRFGGDSSPSADVDNYHVAYKLNGDDADGSIFEAKRLEASGVFFTNFSTTPDSSSHSVTRLESSWTHSIDDGKRQLKLGDSISNSGGWGDAVRFGGVRFGSSESRADLVTTPRLRSYGDAVVPAVADLFVDALRTPTSDTRTPYIISGSPRIAGPDQVSMVVGDALGRTQTITQPLSSSAAFVAKGHTDYSLDVGRIREDFGISSMQYGRWFASSMLRYGLNDNLTLNWRAAQLDDGNVMGLGINDRLGSKGVVSATVASSNSEQDGWLAKFAYEYSDAQIKLILRYRAQSVGYRDIGSEANSTVPIVRQRTLASVGLNLGAMGNIALTGASQTFADSDRGDIVALSHELPLGSYGVISTAAAYSATEASASTLLVSFTHRFAVGGSKKAQLANLNDAFAADNFLDTFAPPNRTRPSRAGEFGIF